jgi:hypothetical protein
MSKKKPVPVQFPAYDPAPLDKKLDTISMEYNAMFQHAIVDTYVGRDLLRCIISNKNELNIYRMYDKMFLYEAVTKSNNETEYVEKEVDRSGDNHDELLSLLNTLALLVDETGDHAPFMQNDETVSVINLDMNGDTNTDDTISRRRPSIHTTILQLEKERLVDMVSSFSNHQGMTELLTKIYGDQSQMCKILRFVDQSFVVSMLGHFGETLISKELRCKDVRGTWKIEIRKHETTFSVIHRRKEQVIKAIGNIQLLDLFQFEWQVEIFLDSHRMHHLDAIHVKLLNTDWTTLSPKLGLTDEGKQEMEKLFRDSFGPSSEISRTDLQVHKSEMAMKRQSEKAKQAIQASSPYPNDTNKGCFSSLMSSDDVNDVFNFLNCKK